MDLNEMVKLNKCIETLQSEFNKLPPTSKIIILAILKEEVNK